MRVKIVGKYWNLIFIKRNGNRSFYGICEVTSSVPKSKVIKIEKGHTDEKTLELIVHECLHAACWDLSEELVTGYAHDVAKVLTKLGYHRDTNIMLPEL